VFRRLRLRLTLLYLLAGFTLVGSVGAGAYGLVRYYFAQTTDLALQHTMAYQFQILGATPPEELQAADREWYSTRRSPPNPVPRLSEEGGEGEEGEGDGAGRIGLLGGGEEAFDSELAAIFVLPLDQSGEALTPLSSAVPFSPDDDAASAALSGGHDWRTTRQPDGSRLRLLTYPVQGVAGLSVLQVGRSLADQDRILRQLLIGLLVLGIPGLAGLSAASWWLAGRSLLQAQTAWDRQQAFVANASHELRTPLTLLRASAEVALRGLRKGDRRAQLLQDILAETDHMSRLVEDQLLLARLDAGKLRLDLRPVAVADVMNEVHRQFARVAEDRGVRLVIDSAAGRAQADAPRLRQLMLILLDNALGNTPAGGTIRMSAAERSGSVEIVVADTGRGIPAEHLPRVFDRFYRADGDASGSGGGTGLGLAIAKGLVEAQRGAIRIESEAGRGTRISLTFPADPL
jgi:signal transduction histidine kinase